MKYQVEHGLVVGYWVVDSEAKSTESYHRYTKWFGTKKAAEDHRDEKNREAQERKKN